MRGLLILDYKNNTVNHESSQIYNKAHMQAMLQKVLMGELH